MRFMMLMIPNENAYKGTGLPDAESVAAMTRYNEQLSRAGVLLALDGLHGPDKGTRFTFDGGNKPVRTDGPFPEGREVVGGYWMIQVKSKEEALEWASRIPGTKGDVVEVRQVFEMSDFPEDVQAAARI